MITKRSGIDGKNYTNFNLVTQALFSDKNEHPALADKYTWANSRSEREK